MDVISIINFSIVGFMMKGVDYMYGLSYILKNIESFRWSDALFLPKDETWKNNTRGMVLDPDDVEDDEDEVPREAKEKNLIYVLNIQTIQGIVRNIREQKANYSEDELLKAFLYYYDNDAYIDLGDKLNN